MRADVATLNSQAVAHLKASRHLEAVVTYGKLFIKLRRTNLTHAQLYACYNNRASAYLHLCMYEEALQDAETARRLAETALQRQVHCHCSLCDVCIGETIWYMVALVHLALSIRLKSKQH